MSQPELYVGVDVGTGSARAGIFDARGRMLGCASHPIRLWRPEEGFAEQSSEDIWQACGQSVRAALREAGSRPSHVGGVGFDATCSLVALDSDDRPVSVSPSGRAEQNIMVWMDHRAVPQAERINATRHPVLRYVGGVISPEMQTPKLLWLRERRPAAWRKAARFLDLPDFLTFRATGDDTRSLCTTVCKWTYLGHRGLDGAGWDGSYFRAIGLGELVSEGYRRIGTRVRPIGEPLRRGLALAAARDLGLAAGTAVGVAVIDAHAGGLGLLGALLPGSASRRLDLNRRIALIGGTSSCHMAVSMKPRFLRGIWGPYYSAMVPGRWLTEGGQTATGALVDHVVGTHAASRQVAAEARAAGTSVYEALNSRLAALARRQGTGHPAELTADLHVQPDFYGNRSPRADPTLRGTMSGLTLSASADDLARQYLAVIQGIAYGTRHIIDVMNRGGYRVDTLMACGGGTKNPVFLREHADATGCRVVLPREPEAVLLGSAVVGAVAARRHPDLLAGMKAMNAAGRIIEPATGQAARYHARKRAVFHRMHSDFLAYRKAMSDPSAEKTP